MSTKLGIISDIHAAPQPLEEALTIFQHEGVDIILCPGDIAGYGNNLDDCITLLEESDCRTILGNHDIWYLEDHLEQPDTAASQFFRNLPLNMELQLEDKKVFMVHASPPDSIMEGIRLLDEEGMIIKQQQSDWTIRLSDFDSDVLIVGHTHQVFAEQLGSTLVVNPGSTVFNHTCGILSLPDMQFQVFALSHQHPVMAWNWGQFFANNKENTD
jgi:putative phosphoesterase